LYASLIVVIHTTQIITKSIQFTNIITDRLMIKIYF